MARPQKEGLDYFPHDTDASSDPKIEPLIILYGAEGYAFYFMHLEYIYKSADLSLDISDAETIQIFTRKLSITEKEYRQILKTALKHRCFDNEYYLQTGRLTSNGIQKRASVVIKKREEMRAAYEAKRGISDAETTQKFYSNEPETRQSKVKESKVNNNLNRDILIRKIIQLTKGFLGHDPPACFLTRLRIRDTEKLVEIREKLQRR